MDRQFTRLKKRLAKKSKRGFRGYPVGTLSCYGPDDRRASKLVAAIVEQEGGDATEIRKWYSEHEDVRNTLEILEELDAFFDRFGVRSVVMLDKIIGCPTKKTSTTKDPSVQNAHFGPLATAGLVR